MTEPRPHWWLLARCAGADPRLFHSERPEHVALAKSVCADCPVAVDCLAFALAVGDEHSVYGGLEPHERGVRPQLGVRPECGTPRGFDRHRRLDESPCQPCVEANRARNRAYEQRRPRRPESRHKKARAAA